MASAYPAGLDTFATNKANATATTTDHPAHHNDLADAVNKIEAELGITPSGSEATVAARFGGLTLSERAVTLPPASGWSWINQGSSTIADIGDGRQVLGAVGVGTQLTGRVRTAPATPYTITGRVLGGGGFGTNDGWGLWFHESATSKLAVIYWNNTRAFSMENWTNATTFSATITSTVTGPSVSWFRITDNGTNLIFSVSSDGFDDSFTQMASVARGSFFTTAPNEIGFFTRNNTHSRKVTLGSWEVD